jgi:hypothetical protein
MFAFHDVFPTAIEILPDCAYEYFHWLDGYEFLTFKHLQLFKHEHIPEEGDSLIWVCRYCIFWCEMFDPLIMEQHLCVECMAIPLEIKTSFRQIVRDRLCAHLQKLFNVVID